MSTPGTTAEALLESVEARLELRRLCGDNFNLFQLLQLEGKEDTLHSRFIAELLDPKGSHDQGDSFLQLFLEQFGDLAWTDDSDRTAAKEWIQAGNVRVEREHWIGPVVIDGEDSSGGQIDIFISNGEHHLSIENKIWSGEGEKQVTRYCNHLPDRNFVLFLTLQGDEADEEARKKPNYRPISYAAHILPWLDSCQRQAKDFPILWGTIKQYIITVKRLTGALTMDSKIRDAVTRDYRAALKIQQTFDVLVSEQKTDLAQRVRKLIEPQAQQQRWEVGKLSKYPLSVVLRHEDWGETKVIWQEDWVGIRDSQNSPMSHEDIHKYLDWPYKRETGNDRYWAYVPEFGFFNTETGIEHLFDESKRSELAEDLTRRLMACANYCDQKLSPSTPN